MERLLLVIEVKLARQLFLERIEQRGLEVLLTFHPQTPVEPHRAAMVTNHRATLSFSL